MRDQNTRAMLIEAVIAAGLIAVGIPTGQPLLVLAAAATSVGCNWTHSLAERGFQHWRDKWFTGDGALNHDISRALCHAFVDAIRQVEHDWKQHRHYQYLERKKPEDAKLTMTALRLLQEDGASYFQQPHQLAQVSQQKQHEPVISLLEHDKFKVSEYIKPALDAFLDGHDDQFVAFVTDQLGSQWILRFLEILKDPGEEGTRAWRACQMLWQKSLMLGIDQVQQTTAETADAVHWLKDWAKQLQSQPPAQRNSTGEDALQGLLHSLHAQLDKMQETLDKTYATTSDIKAMLEQIYSKGETAEEAPARIWTVPYRRNPFFTGREQILTYLHEKLTSSKSVALTQPQAISGLGGIGKTQTAIEYAYRYRDHYRIVLWIKADTPEMLTSDFVTIAHLLNLPEKNAQNQQLIVNAVKHWLEVSSDWLLILDNADDLTIIHDFLPTAGKGHILLTTRARPTGKLAQRIELDKMGMEEGILLLLRRADIIAPDAPLEAASSTDRVQAHELVTLMDGLPLALDQAGAYIEETGSNLAHYHTLYKTRREELLKRRSKFPTDHPEPVASTWSLSFQRLEKLNPAAADLLRVCAFLQPDAISEELLSKGASELGSILASIGNDLLPLDEAVADLLRFSLVRRHPESKTLSVHRLVQVALKDEMDEQTQRSWAERVIRAVNRAFPKRENREVKTWSDWQRYVPHAFACAELIEQWKIILPEAARLLLRAGIYLYNYNRSQLQEAEILLKQAVPVCEQALGREHPETFECLHVLTLLYRIQDRSDKAEPLLQHIVAIREQALGPDHLHTAQSLNELAGFYLSQRKYEQAEPLIKRALATCEQKVGPMHPYLAEFLLNLAKLYLGLDQHEQAEHVIKRLLAVLKQEQEEDPDRSYSNEHKKVSLLCAVISMYMQQGKHELAEPLLIQILKTWGQRYDLEPLTADSCNHLADIYTAQGKYEEAEQLYKRALNIWEQIMGPGDRYRMKSINGLARIYTKQGKFEQAISTYTRTISLSPKYAEAYRGRGYTYLRLKKSEEASADFVMYAALQPGNVNAAWMILFVNMGKQHPGVEIVEHLEAIAAFDPQCHEAYVCRGVALGLRGKVQEGLIEVEKALHIEAKSEDAWFWKGMLCAYLGQSTIAVESIEQALQEDLPPILLTPLFWLEQVNPPFYHEYAEPLLKRYELL